MLTYKGGLRLGSSLGLQVRADRLHLVDTLRPAADVVQDCRTLARAQAEAPYQRYDYFIDGQRWSGAPAVFSRDITTGQNNYMTPLVVLHLRQTEGWSMTQCVRYLESLPELRVNAHLSGEVSPPRYSVRVPGSPDPRLSAACAGSPPPAPNTAAKVRDEASWRSPLRGEVTPSGFPAAVLLPHQEKNR